MIGLANQRVKRLADLAKIERDCVAPESITTGTLYVGLENITGEGGFLGVGPVDAGQLASTKFKFTSKHLLYGKLRPYLRKIARPRFDGICSTDILPILPSAEIDRDYLFHFLRQDAMIAKANSLTAGANLPRLSPRALAEFPIPIIPTAEQGRIAAILDQADALRAKRRQSLAKIDVLTQSDFLEFFGDPATNPKGWEQRELASVGTVITGNTPSRENSEFFGDWIEWIKSDNLNTPHHYLSKAEEGLSQEGKRVARLAPPGSVLVTCIAGSPSCIGNAAIADREVAFNQQINALVPKDTADTCFLYVQFKVGKRLIQQASTSGMKGMVNKSRFEGIKFVWPPQNERHAFGRRFLKLNEVREKQLTSTTQLDALFASLQHRAFKGEL